MTVHGSLPAWMWPLLLVGAAGAVFWAVGAYRQTRPAARRPLDRLLVGLRTASILLLVLGVAGPVLVVTGTRLQTAQLAVVIEDSGSMGLTDVAAGDEAPAAVSRWEAALGAAEDLHRRLAESVGPVDLVLLRGNGLDPLREFRSDDPVVPSPAAHGTDLTGLVAQAGDRLVGRPVRAFVLFSDGQETGGPVGRTTGSGPGAPLHVVETGDPRGPADRILKGLRYPETVFAGDKVVVEFAVDHRYAAAADSAPVVVSLTGEGGVREEVVLDEGAGYLAGEIVFTPASPGLQVFELAVSPLDNERFLMNNRTTLAVDVRRERARLLLVATVPGWDARFLAQAALGEDRLELAVALPAPDGLALADSLTPWPGSGETAPWTGWDGVILQGWPDGTVDWRWEALVRAVEDGAGLLVMPGPGQDPGGSAYGRPAPPELASLLPVEVTAWRPEGGARFLAPARDQAGHPILEGMAVREAERSHGGLGALPPLEAVIPAVPRNGAEVLARAEARGEMPESGRPVLVAWGRERGRVVWFGGRRLWELAFWDYAGPDRAETEQPGRRLLRNLLVWVGAGEEDAGLVLTGRQPFFQEGETVRLVGRWRDVRGRPVADRQVTLELEAAVGDSLRVRTFGMRPLAGEPGTFQAVIPPLPPGDYRVRLRGEGDPPVLGRHEALVVAAHSVEQTQVRSDRRRLVNLAAAGGGEFTSLQDPEAMAQVAARLAALDWSPAESTDRRRFDLRSSWFFLGLASLLLGVEWYVRRRQGQL